MTYDTLKESRIETISSQAPEGTISMGKVQRLGGELVQAITRPRVPDTPRGDDIGCSYRRL